jgi:hypothetical protein
MTQKTLVLSISNAVNGHDVNSARFVECEGIEKLVALLNDDDDEDELSHKAFATLTHLKGHGLKRVLKIIEKLIADEKENQETPLSKYLPILNGLICKHWFELANIFEDMDSSEDFAIKKEAFETVLKLFELEEFRQSKENDEEDGDLAEYGAFILCNLTTLGTNPAILQNWAREESNSFEILCHHFLAHSEENEGNSDVRSMISNVFYNLCFGNEANQKLLVSGEHDDFLQGLASDCLLVSDNFDRSESAKLFLLLYEDQNQDCKRCVEHQCSMILESLRAANLSNVITAKANYLITGGSLKI